MSFIRRSGKDSGSHTSFICLDFVQVIEVKVMTLIHIENASKYYTMGEETIKALDDISLDIDHG